MSKKPLIGKVITVIGASGFVGQNACRFALEYGARVNGVSRRGYPPGYQQFWHKDINWVRGDAMAPSEFSNVLKESDLILHTVGTLIDTTVFKKGKIGGPGSYEHMNRDTLISIANELVSQKYQGNVVYVSGSRPPPFLKRYLTTKQEAEAHLLALQQVLLLLNHKQNKKNLLKSTILRPGFIYSWNHRWWSVPIKYELDLWRNIHYQLNKIIPQNSLMKNLFDEFQVDTCVKLQDLIDSALASCLRSDLSGKILHNQDMEKIAKEFRDSLLK